MVAPEHQANAFPNPIKDRKNMLAVMKAILDCIHNNCPKAMQEMARVKVDRQKECRFNVTLSIAKIKHGVTKQATSKTAITTPMVVSLIPRFENSVGRNGLQKLSARPDTTYKDRQEKRINFLSCKQFIVRQNPFTRACNSSTCF